MAELGSRLRGRAALVTGASRGIGRAIARGLALEGATVVLNHSGRDDRAAASAVAEIMAAGGHAVAIAADLGDPVACDRLVADSVDQLGRLDVVVNNAGICPSHEFLTMPLDVWQRVQDVNHRGTFLVSQAAARHMVGQGTGGRIIAISSISALMGGSMQAHYAPTKAAVASLMQSISIPLAPHGITCNSVLPGAIESDLTKPGWEDPAARAAMEARIPIGRAGTGDDVLAAVLFLASDEASYITGTTILVDGGMYAYLH